MDVEVLSIASEVFPLIKTGGLADVAGALPVALAGENVSMRTLMPGYPDVLSQLDADGGKSSRPEAACHFESLFGGPATVLAARYGKLDLLVLDAPHLYDRTGGPYLTFEGRDHPDNWARFAALSKAGAAICDGAIDGYRPHVLHAHDWQGALAPVYLATTGERDVRSVLTIHNLAFQGTFPETIFSQLGLPASTWSLQGVEYYGNVGYLKGGLHAADAITTVSPTYAEEILTAESGMGLEGLLSGRAARLHGIVNGIDTETWDPMADPAIARPFSRADLAARAANKRALEDEFGLVPGDGPIFSVVSRLSWQKGLDLVAQACDGLALRGARLVVVGSGDAMIEGQFQAAHVRHPGRVSVRIGYDEALSHRVQAGADAILVPSRFEPCGLTQLYGLRYGCVPVVTQVGGLADTVVDANHAAIKAGCATGVICPEPTLHALNAGVDRAMRLYQNRQDWVRMQEAGMETDVSWTASAAAYAHLYRDLLKEKKPGP